MHFLAQLNGADIKTLKITGGEPFTHPAIDDIIELLPRCNFETMILTNALLLTDERIIALKKLMFNWEYHLMVFLPIHMII